MAYSVDIYKEDWLAVIELRDEVHGQDIIDAARGLQRDARWNQRFDVIWDGRSVQSLILKPDDLVEMVEAKAESSVGKEITIAVRELDREMAKLCALLLRVRGREAVVVKSMENALAELGIEEIPSL